MMTEFVKHFRTIGDYLAYREFEKYCAMLRDSFRKLGDMSDESLCEELKGIYERLGEADKLGDFELLALMVSKAFIEYELERRGLNADG